MRTAALIALALAVVAVLAACGEEPVVEPDSVTPTPAEPTPDEPTPDATPTPAPTPDEEADGADEVTAYFAREHESGVWVEPEVVPLDEPTVAVARAALEAVVGHEPREPGRLTLAADGARLLDVDVDGDLLVADFSGLVDDGLGAAFEATLVQQIAHTGAQFDAVEAVRILVDGEEVETLAGHVDVRAPVEPDPFALSPITFTSHETGDEVGVGEVTVGGEACTFEATIELALMHPSGEIVEDTFTTASSGCPERGEWQHTFTIPEEGWWAILATEPDPSAGEGRPPFQTSLELDVS